MNARKACWVAGFLLGFLYAQGQTPRVDSLLKRVHAARAAGEKLTALLSLFEEYHSVKRDTLDAYGEELKMLAASSGNLRYRSLATLAYANWYYRWGWSDSALYFIEPELARNPVDKPATRDVYFKLMRAKAMYLGSKSRFAEALDVLYKALTEAEKYKDPFTTGLVSNSIGSVSIARQEPADGLAWARKAILAGGSDVQVLAPAYINAALACSGLGKTDSALYYINRALPLCRDLQNLNYLAVALRVRTNIYSALRNYREAETSLLEMIQVRRELSPANFYVEDNLQLADFYASSGQIEKAIEICRTNLQKGPLEESNDGENKVVTNDPKLRVTYLQRLAGYYRQAGRLYDYQATLEELVDAKDSLYAANSADAIAGLQTKYEVQKKENTILQQKYDLQRKNFLFYAAILLTAVLLITGMLMFRNYRLRQRKRVEKLMEEERRQAREAVRQAEEKERVRIASDLHDNLGAYAASMASNLSYIEVPAPDEKTQRALAELSRNSMAIISQLNDTIWVLKRDELRLTDISDRLKNFISRLRNSYPEMTLEIQENIATDHLLPASQAFHLYRILQEAVNNALRHSRGRQILVTITADRHWEVTVEDDGIGFSGNPGSWAEGNGLDNMRERSREAGWELRWESRLPQGTVVRLAPTTN